MDEEEVTTRKRVCKPRPLIEYVCNECGKKYLSKGRHTRYCPDCRKKCKTKYMAQWFKDNRKLPAKVKQAQELARVKKNDAREEERRLNSEILREVEYTDTSKFNMKALMCAKTRPHWCSPRRWHIELMRRKNSKFYRTFGLHEDVCQ